MPDDASWIRLALERFEKPLTRYALGLTGDLERARDVVQDTFLRLCLQPKAELEQRLAPWLYRVCRNRALDVRKKEARTLPLETARSESRPSPEPLPSLVLDRSQRLSSALAIIATLPEQQQEVLRLRFQAELSYREISDVTGLSVSNVGFVLHHALRKVRETLERDADPSAAPLRRVR